MKKEEVYKKLRTKEGKLPLDKCVELSLENCVELELLSKKQFEIWLESQATPTKDLIPIYNKEKHKISEYYAMVDVFKTKEVVLIGPLKYIEAGRPWEIKDEEGKVILLLNGSAPVVTKDSKVYVFKGSKTEEYINKKKKLKKEPGYVT